LRFIRPFPQSPNFLQSQPVVPFQLDADAVLAGTPDHLRSYFRFIFKVTNIQKVFLLIGIFTFANLVSSATAHGVRFLNNAHETIDLPYLTLRWEPFDEDLVETQLLFEIERAESPDFTDAVTYYRGPDRASFVAGLAEGEYFFRIRSFEPDQTPGEWNDSLRVTVQYKSLALAFLLFGIGAVVSIATIVLVAAGDRETRRETAQNA